MMWYLLCIFTDLGLKKAITFFPEFKKGHREERKQEAH